MFHKEAGGHIEYDTTAKTGKKKDECQIKHSQSDKSAYTELN